MLKAPSQLTSKFSRSVGALSQQPAKLRLSSSKAAANLSAQTAKSIAGMENIQTNSAKIANANIKPLTKSQEKLMDACKRGNVDDVYTCVLDRVDLNCRLPHYGTTPLSMAFRHGHKMVCNVLIQFGAKPDPDNYGATPLHWAANNNQSELIRDQVKRGHISRTDLAKRDFFGSSPLHFGSGKNLHEVVKTLLDCGADSLIANNDGRLASQITDDEKAEKLDADIHKHMEEEERQKAREIQLANYDAKKKKGKQQAKNVGIKSGKTIVIGARREHKATEKDQKSLKTPGPRRVTTAWTEA
ncbi:hypothetical protein HK100_012790 [Physocladia obscura]|uniref:Ankyrin n=1 Tax=Physocladia obscura TaxID=109957 RepID=A0AAD5T1U1_9FUNG|nr:hypothetical protein HK100_012790 [Physocladia obscura]